MRTRLLFTMIRGKAIALGLLLTGAGIAAAVLTTASPEPPDPTGQAATVQRVLEFAPQDLTQAHRETIARTIPVTGMLTPLNEAVVKTRAPGLLTAVLAREGETVREGQLLVRMDETEIRARLAERQADIAMAEAQLGLAQRNLAQQRALLDKGYISRNSFDNAQNNEQVARARLAAARAQLAQITKALADTQLPSPIAGVVARRHAERGERLAADAPVLTVVALDKLELAVDVPVTDIARVTPGQTVSVRVDGFGEQTFEGRVERINPQATAGAGVVPVYVIVTNPGQVLRVGLFAHGELVLSAGEPRITVPASALHERDGEQFVFAIENSQLVKKPVRVAFTTDSRAVIAEGLTEGATVVAVNLGLLPEGARINPVAAGQS